MNACELSNDLPRTFFAAVIGPKLHAAVARLERCSEDRARRRVERISGRRSRQMLREIAELPSDVRKDVGYNRDF
jgi:hypothetical protein